MEKKQLLNMIFIMLNGACLAMQEKDTKTVDYLTESAYDLLKREGIIPIEIDDYDLGGGDDNYGNGIIWFTADHGKATHVKRMSEEGALHVIRTCLDNVHEALTRESGLTAGLYLRRAQKVARLVKNKTL